MHEHNDIRKIIAETIQSTIGAEDTRNTVDLTNCPMYNVLTLSFSILLDL